MTEGLRLAGKEGFDGNKAVGACFTGCPVLKNCTRSVNDGAGSVNGRTQTLNGMLCNKSFGSTVMPKPCSTILMAV